MNIDPQDTKILKSREKAFKAIKEPKPGDFIHFADGTLKRIAHVWTDENGKAESIQPTAYAGDISFYLGTGYMSYSGSLNPGIPAEKFTRTKKSLPGQCWIFHHDYAGAGRGINVKIMCPVWNCNQPAKE
jgi:hypothetical protein